MAGAFLTLFGDPWVTVLSDPRCALGPCGLEGVLCLRGGGAGLAARFGLIDSSDLVSDPDRFGQTNLSIHLRLGGDEVAAASDSEVGGGVGAFGFSLFPQAKVMHRLRTGVSTVTSAGRSFLGFNVETASCCTMTTLRSRGFSVIGSVLRIVVALRGGLMVGLGTLRPSSLVSSAVDAALCVLQAEWVLNVRGGCGRGVA